MHFRDNTLTCWVASVVRFCVFSSATVAPHAPMQSHAPLHIMFASFPADLCFSTRITASGGVTCFITRIHV